MTTPQAISKIFARCRSCGEEFVAERGVDGTVRPVGKASMCACQKQPAVA